MGGSITANGGKTAEYADEDRRKIYTVGPAFNFNPAKYTDRIMFDCELNEGGTGEKGDDPLRIEYRVKF